MSWLFTYMSGVQHRAVVTFCIAVVILGFNRIEPYVCADCCCSCAVLLLLRCTMAVRWEHGSGAPLVMARWRALSRSPISSDSP